MIIKRITGMIHFFALELGGGGGSPPPATSTTNTQVNYSPEEAAARARVQAEAERIYGATQGSFTNASYPGAAPVPFSQDTLQAQDYLRKFAVGEGSQVAGQTAQALKFGLGDVLNPNSNPALQQTLNTATRQVGQAYTDPGGVMSKIRGTFTGDNSGGTGTREGIAGGLAARSYLDTIGDVTGKITSDAYKSGLDTFSKTLAFAPQAYNLMTQPALTQAAVGQQNEAMEQAQANYGSNQQMWGLNAPWMGLQNYANVVYGGSNPTTTMTGTSQGGTSPGMGRMGGALQGAAIGTSIMPGWGTAIGAGLGLLMGG